MYKFSINIKGKTITHENIVHVMCNKYGLQKRKIKIIEVKMGKVKAFVLDSTNHIIKTDWFELSDLIIEL